MKTEEQILKLKPFVTENRQKLIGQVLDLRTRYLTVVLEDVWKAQNASAVMRTCECLGVQDLYLVEKKHEMQTYQNVVLGAEKWLSLFRYTTKDAPEPMQECLSTLRKKGYRICATYLSDDGIPLSAYDISRPTAFIFGTEREGISEHVIREADDLITIPMSGFTDSLNLSASVAMVLQHAFFQLSENDEIYLSGEEKTELCLDWYKKVVKGAEQILERG